MTALIMFLPHIPNDIAMYLPALFNIYCRILFWERERELSSGSISGEPDTEKNTTHDNEVKESLEWEQLSYSFESDGETVPELAHYFTFLYGLYPINFMSYIRKPGRYLRHANSEGGDDIEVQPSEIRQRSEPFRQVHLLHPNFYTMTIESELTDLNRWMNSEAADVVAACMALCAPVYPEAKLLPRAPPEPGHIPVIKEVNDVDHDPSDMPLLSRDDVRTEKYHRLSTETDNASWRNTTSTIVGTPDGSRRQSSTERKVSQSTSMPIADSPTLGPLETQTDSPTLPPPLLSTHPRDSFVNPPMFQGGLQQSFPNESEISFISSQQREPSIADSYLQSLENHHLENHQVPGSPSLQASPTEENPNISSLRREIMLLRNELNFERYLKQQHLSHIGELRRKHVKEATVEAETQNLINSNKMLRSKLDEAKNTMMQMKKESEMSRAHSKKWEGELTAKLRVLREEQKKWNVETEALRRDLESSIQRNNELKLLVVTAEAEALGSKQKVQSIEGNVDELERLRAELDKLTGSLRTYEAREVEIERAKASEALSMTKVEILEMKLQSRENELEIVRRAADRERDALKMELEEARMDLHNRQPHGLQSMLDDALQVSRSRLLEAQKAHGHLLMKYTKLQGQYLALKDYRNPDEPLLSGDGDDSHYGFNSGYRSGSPVPIRRIRRRGLSDPDLGDRSSHSLTSPSEHSSGYFPIRPARNNMTESAPRPSSQNEVRSPGQGLTGSQTLRHMRSGSADSAQAGAGLNLTATGVSLDATGKPKIKPNSEVRVYGRGSYSDPMFLLSFIAFRGWRLTAIIGGVQNVGTTPKDKKKKDKQKEGEDKKDKKSTGLRGIRGFA
jgi:solute carrier family 25 (mitochondrial carrier protein), member 16